MDNSIESIAGLLREEILGKRSSHSLVKLASERTYEAKYQVGRQRIRTAINTLVSEGLLVKNEGGATYILPEIHMKSLYIIYPQDIRISDPFYSNLWLNITTLAAKHGIDAIFIPAEDALHYPQDQPMVLIGIQEAALLRKLRLHFNYLVGVQTYSTDNDMIHIYFDNKKIGYTAVKTLLEHGHRNLVCVAGPSIYTSARLRRAGFIKACERFQASYEILSGKMNWSGGYAIGTKLAEMLNQPDPPTAAFVANDWMSIGMIQYLKEQGVSVPEDFSVISVDNIPIAAQVSPALTTFSQDMSLLTAELFATVNQITPETYDDMMLKRIVMPHILINRQTLMDNKGANENA